MTKFVLILYRRETKFRQEFSSNDYNRFYSKPRNMSPEEMEKYFKSKAANPQKYFFLFFGGMLLIAVFEAGITT